jgi:hypothetical protein
MARQGPRAHLLDQVHTHGVGPEGPNAPPVGEQATDSPAPSPRLRLSHLPPPPRAERGPGDLGPVAAALTTLSSPGCTSPQKCLDHYR